MVFGNHINDKNVFISPKKTSSKALSFKASGKTTSYPFYNWKP